MPAVAERLERLAEAANTELRENIIPFWLRARAVNGAGFAGTVSRTGRKLPSAAKGVVLHSRILWFFSEAFLEFGDDQLIEAARCAFDFISDCLVDREFGGVFWSVDADGLPDDTDKHIYAQAFAMMGLAAFYRASGDQTALSLGREIWETTKAQAVWHGKGGCHESYSRVWEPAGNEKMGRPAATRTFNAHFHLAEGMAALRDVWPDEQLDRRLRELLDFLTIPLVDLPRGTFRQGLDEKLHLLDTGPSYGHDIEATWLLPRFYDTLDIGTPPRVTDALNAITDTVLVQALGDDGSVASGFDLYGQIQKVPVWWVQAEALVGFLDAFERRDELQFLDAAERVWSFIESRMIDRQHGEWFEFAEASGFDSGISPKVHAWKCPYHNGRACLEVRSRARRIADKLNISESLR